MIDYQIHAQIYKSKVMNILVSNYYLADKDAKDRFGADAFAVDCQYWSVGVGDTYKDGKFYNAKNGEECIYRGSAEENAEHAKQIAEALIKENETLRNTIADLTEYILSKED